MFKDTIFPKQYLKTSHPQAIADGVLVACVSLTKKHLSPARALFSSVCLQSSYVKIFSLVFHSIPFP